MSDQEKTTTFTVEPLKTLTATERIQVGDENNPAVTLRSDGNITSQNLTASEGIQVGDENNPAVSLDSNGKVVAEELNIAGNKFDYKKKEEGEEDWNQGLRIDYAKENSNVLLFQEDGMLAIRNKTDDSLKWAAGSSKKDSKPHIYIGNTKFYEDHLKQLLKFLKGEAPVVVQQIDEYMLARDSKHPNHSYFSNGSVNNNSTKKSEIDKRNVMQVKFLVGA